ncbi:Alpha/beta superfamily hydrolase [Halanaeroarchaeum sp. HSR-CO]|uniref:alpha/beta fold hydrolase n=1 Tax=Halanaeroarchaeum sp. HSR-CO TaxID=2866382 RepID=UPI00217E9CCE|nr:alpha/beta hydrolase [Halanaeroarchaeum sp. HSR-CO]UWG48479.1 Alpha/beta superfamily hydrolase [Halanaeroarchaeum sp. HSR-CO]
MHSVHHDGRETEYRVADREASGPTLVFVHGSGGSHEVWKSQLARLSGEYRIVALDLSGHGRSADVATQDGPTARERYVEDLLAVTEAVDGDVLVGNSLGGAVVLSALLDRDPSVDAAILAGSGAKLAVLEDLRDWLADDFDRAIAFLHGEDMFFHDPDPRLDALSRECMRAVDQRVTERDFLASHTFDVRDRLDAVAVPVLALTGEYDRLTPPEYHEYLAEHVPAGDWTTVSDAAHLSMLEAPERFNAVLREFVAERSG